MNDYLFLHTNDPYALTPMDIVKAKLDMLELKDGETLIDLGAGDGRSLILACQLADIKGVGYEISKEAQYIANQNIKEAGLDHKIKIIHENMLQADVSQADAVFLYLTRTMLGALSLKLENELKPGAKIVTHQFDLPAWTAVKEIEFQYSNCMSEPIYLYRKG
ncbi:SAM-dependent methyltransferase [Aureibacter tunicatorum]|uniref:Cyclopropane fatty-acyl-phospholipid synthase-like methyltransferase n=1 Tax=Aureibacter tunicatorum TaxID=866807 RepID=A0AAE3XP09_9BACT|nr:class I SAM-dependent methyltransferase [Aureibacter tunicatorum]MDR6240467.1 cyclopropane fatty-acyl-phospholipid synthase-like methyltransferase [Aureibacter tunicatorum]BDD05654.1 RNA methyltransferase [Aureibacter tunicatorum]